MERSASLRRIAQIQRKLQQPDLAFAALARALEQTPADPALQQLAEDAAVEADAVETLVEVLAEQVARTQGPGRVAIHLRLASLNERRLSNPQGAIDQLRAAVAASPHEVSALEALRRLHHAREEWAALAEVTEKLARHHAVLADQVASWRIAARLHKDRLFDDESALACWMRVFELAPDDAEALEAVRGLATTLDRPAELTRVTRAIGQAAGKAPFDSAQDRPRNPTQSLLKALQAFEEGADRLAKLPDLLRLAEQADALEEVAEAVEAASEEVKDDAELTELLRFVARLRERLKQPEAAQVSWNDLLAVRPADPEALEHLLRLFKQAGDARNAAEVGVRQARQTIGVADRLERLLEAARLYEDAGAGDDAIRTLEESLQTRADVRALKALDRLLADTPQAALQARVLDELTRLEPAANTGKLHLRRGQLLSAAEPLAAVAAYAQALQLGGIEAEAIAGLRTLLGNSAARSAAAQTLEPVFRAGKDVRSLAEVIEAQLEGSRGKADRLARLTEVATLWESAREPRAALGARLRAFALGSGEEKVRADLERLATGLGAQEELLAAYEEALERGLEPNPGPLWRKIAELHDARGQRDPAAAAWEKAAATAPRDLALLRAFGDRCRALGDLTRLAAVLKRQVEASPEPARQTELLIELAQLAEHELADDARAAWAYEELSRRSPRDRGLLATLQRLYERSQDGARLGEALARDLQLARATGAAEALAIALRLAQLKLDRVRDDAGALVLLRDVLRQHPKNPEAVAGLVRLASTDGPVQPEAARLVAPLLDTQGDHAALVRLLTAQVPSQTDPAERARLWRQISDLHAGPLKDAESAFLAIAHALHEAPQDPALLQRCIALAQGSGAADELCALLEELAAAVPKGPARAALQRSLAQAHEACGDSSEAISVWSQVQLVLPADDEAHRRLAALLEQAGRQTELAALHQQRTETAPATERPAALLALAEAREKLGQLDAAADTLRTLFALTRGLEALAALERVLGNLGRHRERAEVLGRIAAATPEGRGRTDGFIRQAKALMAAGESELAVALFTDLLARPPIDDRVVAELVTLAPQPRVRLKVAAALEPVYRDPEHRWPRLAVLEVLVANADPGRERPLRTEVAQIYEALGEPRQAFVERLRLVRLFIEDDQIRGDAERLAIAAQMEEELVAVYEDLLDRPLPPAVTLALYRASALLYSGRLASPRPAARMWAEVARLEPGSLEPLQALARIYRQIADFPVLAKVLGRQVALLPTVDAQIDVLTELAGVAEESLRDFGLAAEACRQILQRSRLDLNALRSLARMLEPLGLHVELSEVLQRLLTLADGHQRADEAADLQVRLGQLALGPLQRPDDALRHFARSLERKADDPQAVAGLEALLVREPRLRAPTAAILEGVYRRRADTPRLADTLELQLPATDPERELALYDELARLRETLGDPTRAYLARRELFVRRPADAPVRAELERLAELTSRLDDLAAIYREQLTKPLADPLAAQLWRRVAATHQRLGQRPQAAQAWEEVARLEPKDPAPLVALCALYREERAFVQLPRLLRLRAALAPSSAEQVSLWLELVDIAELQLFDPALAIESCRAASACAPEDRNPLSVLERLLEENRLFEELCTLLLEQIARAQARTDDAVELTLRVRLARVRHRSLQDTPGALELVRGILRRRPDHADALATGQELMRAGGPLADEAAAVLEPLFVKAQAWVPLLEVLQVRAAACSGAARAALMHRIADLLQGPLAAPALALETLSTLLREAPDDPSTLRRCLELGELANAPGKLASLLTELLPLARADQARVAILRPLARLRETLGEADDALQSWRALLELGPGDDEALDATVRLLEASWRWGELVEVLELRLGHATAGPERASLLARIGATREDSLSDRPGAYTAFRAVLELSPDDLPALHRLDRLCGQLDRWPEQAEVLARRIRLEPDEQLALRLRLAEVRRTRLGDPAGALPLVGEVLASSPGHPGAIAELEQLVEGEPDFGPASEMLLGGYHQLGDPGRLASFLEWRAALASQSQRRRALWLELARLRLEQQNDPELGFLAIARAYRETPEDAALQAQVIALAATAGTQDALAALLEEVLPLLTAPSAGQTSLALAEVYEGPLGDPERAAACYRTALEKAPALAPRALRGLARVLEALQKWAELLPVLEASESGEGRPSTSLGMNGEPEARPSPGEAVERIALLLRIAALADEKLGRPERAVKALRDVLALEASHLGAARGLEALFERSGQTTELLEILEHLLRHAPGRERQALRLKLARLSGESDRARAIALCRELLADDPLHREGFALLVGHLEAEHRHDELGALLRDRRAVTLDPPELASLDFQLGELSYRRLGKPEPALPHYREVLDRAPRHLGALTALVEIYEALGQRSQLAQALGDLAEVVEAAPDRRAHLLRRAEVLASLGSRDLALVAARDALELGPDQQPELVRLLAVFRAFDAAPEIARALGAQAEVQLRDQAAPAAVKTLLELAAVRDRLNEPAAASAALEKILILEPSNRIAFDRARALFARTVDWTAYVRLVARFLPSLSAAERPATLDELAEIHESRLADPAAAFSWACEAVRLDPAPTARTERVQRLALSLGRPAELALLYREILELQGRGPAHERLCLALARIEDESLDEVDAAEKTLGVLLAHDPSNAVALEALVRLFSRRGLQRRHAAALELKLEATHGQEARAVLLTELAELHEDQLADPLAAAQALRRLVELEKDPQSAALLAALHRRHRQWPQTLIALQWMLKLSPPATRARVQLEAAELCEKELGDPEAAASGYLQALTYEPASVEAFHAVQRIFRKLDRPAELLRAVEQRLTQTADVDEQISLLYEAAELFERKTAPLQADRRLERILQLRPREVRALEGLERLRRAGERWTALAETLSRHVDVADTAEQKASLCGSLGELSRQALRDDDGAVRWWKRSLEYLPLHRPALHALAELHQVHGHWLEATRLLGREAELETDPAVRAQLEYQAGLLREERLHDLTGATASYHRALAAEATHLPSLRRLRALCQRAGDWPGYEQTLTQEGEHAPEAADRAAASLELGRHFQTRAREPANAIRWYEHALTHRPELLDAALPLCDLLIADGDWRKAAPVLKVAVALLERGGPSKRPELILRLCRLGDAQRQVKGSGSALDSYERALKLEPTQPGALRGRAELFEDAGKATEAAEQYELLLRHHEKTLKPSERAELRVRLARLWAKLGSADRALPLVEKALEADPVHPAALRLGIELSDQAAAWDKAAVFRQRLAGVTRGDEKYRLLVELGKLAQDKLSSPALALKGFATALELRPDSLEVLERLHGIYRAAGQPQSAATTLQALVAHQDLTEDARRLHTLALAELLAKTLHEEERAAAVLETALDRAPEFLQALQALEALWVQGKRWKALGDAYERMIRRLDGRPGSAVGQAVLWRTLAELRHRKSLPGAFEAYAAGARLVPGDAKAQEALADFAVQFPEHEQAAVAAYVRAIPTTASVTRVCGALARLAEKRGDPDSRVLCAGAAAFYGSPGADEEKALRELGKFLRSPAQLRSPVSDDQWKRLLLHPSLRGPLGQLMALVYEEAGSRLGADLSDFKLHPKRHRIELGESRDAALNNLRFIARTLGFEGLNLYSPFLASRVSGRAERHPDEAVGLRVNPTFPLSLFVGEPLLHEADLPGLCAHLGSTIALLRPELAMAVLVPPEELAGIIEAALGLGDPTYAPRGDPKQLKVEQKRLRKSLTPHGQASVVRLTAALLKDRGQRELAMEYFDGVRHTTARAALLVAGDFAPVKARALPMQSARADLFVRELIAFAVGGELHALRLETGSQLTPR